ncbi:MAG: hypothetical protein Q7S87_01220 [Agitococcus sp.]|nr:hypothetical protein [Agitococcus sp.]MDO9179146.1 hypothetical protein [Agitococcus sp.]
MKTFALSQTLMGDWRLLRLLPAYRTAASTQIRNNTAVAVKLARRNGTALPSGPFRNIVSSMPSFI